jgi:hypothetical protein
MEKGIRISDIVSGAILTKSDAFSHKFFFRKNFFLLTFDKRQTIEGYEKMHSQLRYSLRRYTDEK